MIETTAGQSRRTRTLRYPFLNLEAYLRDQGRLRRRNGQSTAEDDLVVSASGTSAVNEDNREGSITTPRGFNNTANTLGRIGHGQGAVLKR
ncbi:hypothetical protein D9613_012905 [Agrocybe pediades]|uniref:Uncharacterized protein n=1 Tax=Agrocybe pediades TaxID=84607 RepID=A0A8H4QR20_9AGAR|nr:hypothetical protein D9613_012905 [Agrocybe pediades]